MLEARGCAITEHIHCGGGDKELKAVLQGWRLDHWCTRTGRALQVLLVLIIGLQFLILPIRRGGVSARAGCPRWLLELLVLAVLTVDVRARPANITP